MDIVLLIGLTVPVLALLALQRYWHLDSLTDTVAESLARILPLPGRGSASLRRALIRRVCCVMLVMPSGQRHAVTAILVRIAPEDEVLLTGGTDIELLTSDLAGAYSRHARKSGWTLTRTPSVQVEIDPRLRSGWVRAHAVPTSTDVSRVRDQIPSASAFSAHPGPSVPGSSDITLPATGQADEEMVTEQLTEPSPAARHLLIPLGTAPALTGLRDGVVGRGPEAVIGCEHHRVSRRHATVEWTPSGWLLSDLGSLNGTYVDDLPVQEGQLLRPGQRVMFGHGGPAYEVRVPGR